MYHYSIVDSILKMPLTHHLMTRAENSDIPAKGARSRTHSYLIYLLNLTTNKTNLVIVISPIILEEHDVAAIRASSRSKIQFTCALCLFARKHTDADCFVPLDRFHIQTNLHTSLAAYCNSYGIIMFRNLVRWALVWVCARRMRRQLCKLIVCTRVKAQVVWQ